MNARVLSSCLSLLMLSACPELNPNFMGSTGDGTTVGTTTTGSSSPSSSDGSMGTAVGSSGTMPPASTSGMMTTAADSTTAADTTTSDSTGPQSTGDAVDLGFPCTDSSECDQSIGAECCTANECVNTCMVPCNNPSDCPMADMGCEHGYCLFPCNWNDADCEMWPGYVCEHGGFLCEFP